ncbi:MAG: LytTR family transcriptional regulator [Lachnospiraceae bacterium]|nr:LytTR family transcriptional regulator [Lachnospiraceae bacterium]MCR5501139.1 LytTR family transcriptional regulator [Acetatifactor sp.]
MRVEINVSEDVKEPYVVIHTGEVTPEISELAQEISGFQHSSGMILGTLDERIVILKQEEIILVRVENDKVFAVTPKGTFQVGKRLYELLDMLGNNFIQVSKSAAINLKCLESVEPSFSGVMLLHLKNGEKEYISRKFVPQLKKRLGL